jgi:hypothetical protein
MVIHNLYIRRTGRAFHPIEANPPLVINADAKLPFPVSLQDLKPVAGQGSQIAQSRSRF